MRIDQRHRYIDYLLPFAPHLFQNKKTYQQNERLIADKIRSFPRHIHTRLYQNIDPEGILLSGGEMQRLVLARALYKDAET